MTRKDKFWKVFLPELYNPIKAATMENGKRAVKNAHTLIPVKLFHQKTTEKVIYN